MLGDADAQHAAKASLQRLAHFLEMRQRLADFLAAGDDDAVGIEQPESGQRHLLGRDEIRHHARAERDEGRIGRRGRRARLRSRWQHALVDEFEPGPDRLIRFVGVLLSAQAGPCAPSATLSGIPVATSRRKTAASTALCAISSASACWISWF